MKINDAQPFKERNLHIPVVRKKPLEINTDEITPKVCESEIEKLTIQNNLLQKKLDQSQYELSQFAHIASHDLQEPLRKIQICISVLSEQEGISEKANDYLLRATKSSERMSLLIADLQKFATLADIENNRCPVDLNSIADEVLNDFERIITEKNAMVVVGNLPVIDAVALEMNQLIYNIISNALKFTDSRRPLIEIGAVIIAPFLMKTLLPNALPELKYYDIFVRDNGIGFDSKYAEKIFEVFTKMHANSVYPGSGIGLALCRRIVENHGGLLYAESVQGSGSTFHMILPQTENK